MLQFGQAVTISIFVFISSVIIGFLIRSIINEYRKKYDEELTVCEIFSKYKENWWKEIEEQYSKNHKKIFTHSLISAKLTVIALLGFITFVYQLKYDKELYFRTYLGMEGYRWKIYVEVALSAGLGMLTAIIITISRRKSIKASIPNVIVIGLILALFSLTQEASGFNRYISSDIKNKKGAYYKIDIVNTASQKNMSVDEVFEMVETIENGGDPFAISWAYVASAMMCLITFRFIVNMFTAGYFGYISGELSPYRSEATYIRIPFKLEIFLAGFLNVIAPVVSPFIREGTMDVIQIMIAIAICFAAVSLHIMFQYNGFLELENSERNEMINYDEILDYRHPDV
jgi:hypothetical protein